MARPRELVATWALAIALLAAARLLSPLDPTGLLAGNLAGVGALVFVLLPDRALRARGLGWGSCGLPALGTRRGLAAWGKGALWAAGAAAAVFPALVLGVAALGRVRPELAAAWGLAGPLRPRLPPGLALQALLQLLVVALPEELFYRGWMQTSWRMAGAGRARRLLGADLGPGFLWTQALFAVGHLASLQPSRLLTFLPALLFGWLRERTGGLAAPVLMHALSNLLLKVLQASLGG